jgi:hypothetical protein
MELDRRAERKDERTVNDPERQESDKELEELDKALQKEIIHPENCVLSHAGQGCADKSLFLNRVHGTGDSHTHILY